MVRFRLLRMCSTLHTPSSFSYGRRSTVLHGNRYGVETTPNSTLVRLIGIGPGGGSARTA